MRHLLHLHLCVGLLFLLVLFLLEAALLVVFLVVSPSAFVAAFPAFQDLAAPAPPLAAPGVIAALWEKGYPVFEARLHLHSIHRPPMTFVVLLRCCYCSYYLCYFCWRCCHRRSAGHAPKLRTTNNMVCTSPSLSLPTHQDISYFTRKSVGSVSHATPCLLLQSLIYNGRNFLYRFIFWKEGPHTIYAYIHGHSLHSNIGRSCAYVMFGALLLGYFRQAISLHIHLLAGYPTLHEIFLLKFSEKYEAFLKLLQLFPC